MRLIRLSILSTIILVCAGGTALAQRQRPPRVDNQFPSRCDPWEYRTKLEEFEYKHETILIKGYTNIATLTVREGTARIEAMELRDAGDSTRALGIAVAFTDVAHPGVENRALVDYEEINPLIKGLDTVARADETITKLVNFEMRYRTRGDLELAAFRQMRFGAAVALSSGICDRATMFLTLEELQRFRGMLVEAKARLDEIK